jgi:hypothetical protein
VHYEMTRGHPGKAGKKEQLVLYSSVVLVGSSNCALIGAHGAPDLLCQTHAVFLRFFPWQSC